MFEYLTYLSLINWKKIGKELSTRFIKTGKGEEELLRFLLFKEKLDYMMNHGEQLDWSEGQLKNFLIEARGFIEAM